MTLTVWLMLLPWSWPGWHQCNISGSLVLCQLSWPEQRTVRWMTLQQIPGSHLSWLATIISSTALTLSCHHWLTAATRNYLQNSILTRTWPHCHMVIWLSAALWFIEIVSKICQFNNISFSNSCWHFLGKYYDMFEWAVLEHCWWQWWSLPVYQGLRQDTVSVGCLGHQLVMIQPILSARSLARLRNI